MLSRSAITLPKVNRYGWNLEHPEYIVGTRELALTDFGRNPRSSDSWRARRNFLSGNQSTTSSIFRRPNLRKCEHNTSISVAIKTFGILTIFPQGPFSKKRKNLSKCSTSGHHNFAMITDCRKFTTKITHYWISSFLSTVGINSKLFPWTVHFVQATSPNFLRRPTRLDNTADNADITQSQAANHHPLLSHVTLGLVECRK